jgi:hypothetical protein
MPYSIIDTRFADLLKDADDLLGARSLDTHEDEKCDLKIAAGALAKYAFAHREDYGTRIYRQIKEVKAEIRSLKPNGKKFAEKAANLRLALEMLADRCDFQLPVPPDAKPGPSNIIPPIVRDGVEWDDRVIFDDVVTPDRLVEYALATSMYSPLAQSAYHKRKQLTPLLLTALLARGTRGIPVPGDDDEPDDGEPPTGGVDDDTDGDDTDGDDTDTDNDDGDDTDGDDTDNDDDTDDDDTDDDDDDDDDDTDDDDDDDDDDDNDTDDDDDTDTDDDTDGQDTGGDGDDTTTGGGADDGTGSGEPTDDGGDDTGGDDTGGADGGDDNTKGSVAHLNVIEGEFVELPPRPPIPIDPLIRRDGETRLRALIDHVIQGGAAGRPDLLGQLAHAQIRSPEELLAFTARGWTRNINEGRHLHNQLLRVLGQEHGPALPQHDELDRLVKAARREIREHDHPVA